MGSNGSAVLDKPKAPSKKIAHSTETAPQIGVDEVVTIPRMEIKEATIHIVGLTPLIVHNWDKKAKGQIRDKHAGKAAAKKAFKVDKDDYNASLYWISEAPEVYGFPAIAFKDAAATAWAHVDGFRKGILLGCFHIVNGVRIGTFDLVPLSYGKLAMREDMVRIPGAVDIRYRGEYTNWSVDLNCKYNSRVISLEQLCMVLDTAGFAVGVGEWRPQKGGSSGMFRVGGASPE